MPQVPNFQDQQRLQRVATDRFAMKQVIGQISVQSVMPAPSQTPSVTPTVTVSNTSTPTPTPTIQFLSVASIDAIQTTGASNAYYNTYYGKLVNPNFFFDPSVTLAFINLDQTVAIYFDAQSLNQWVVYDLDAGEAAGYSTIGSPNLLPISNWTSITGVTNPAEFNNFIIASIVPTPTPTPPVTPTVTPYLPGGPSRFFYSDRASTISFDSVIDNASYESYFNTLTAVKISDGVQRIDDRPYGYGPFQNQTNLSAVSLGNGLTSIGDFAFYGCSSLTGIAIPNSVIKIGQYAFNNCTNNRNTTVGNSVSAMGQDAFQGNQNLVTITIPSSVVFIGRYAFANCTNTEAIYFQGDAPVIGGDGILGNIKLFPPGSVYYCDVAQGFSNPFAQIPAYAIAC